MGLERTVLTIDSATGQHKFDVQIARTIEQQELGFMYRHSLAPNEGMLFPYDPPQYVTYWMKNTFVPLDLIFVGSNHRIVRIGHGKPLDLTMIPSGDEVIAVLEIPGGRSAKLGIKAGDRVYW